MAFAVIPTLHIFLPNFSPELQVSADATQDANSVLAKDVKGVSRFRWESITILLTFGPEILFSAAIFNVITYLERER